MHKILLLVIVAFLVSGCSEWNYAEPPSAVYNKKIVNEWEGDTPKKIHIIEQR
jgi:PBP1b-binding outer membrane lipoprotein LpoB